ncbi:MAG: dTDP-4-dehydrorhamnose 3,5-epimerase [Candidatus Micrarchaeia archaeon]
MEFEFKSLGIKDIVLIKRKKFSDLRGELIKEFETTPFVKVFEPLFKEEYISISKKNVIRGLHYQIDPKPQGKLVSVIRGKILEVAVDIRKESPTYLKSVSVELSSDMLLSLWIPPGFAHGFLTLSDESIVLTRCNNEYDPLLEKGIRWNDPKIGVNWPINEPILSEKDKNWELL